MTLLRDWSLHEKQRNWRTIFVTKNRANFVFFALRLFSGYFEKICQQPSNFSIGWKPHHDHIEEFWECRLADRRCHRNCFELKINKCAKYNSRPISLYCTTLCPKKCPSLKLLTITTYKILTDCKKYLHTKISSMLLKLYSIFGQITFRFLPLPVCHVVCWLFRWQRSSAADA